MGELVFADGWGNAAPWAVDPPGTRHTSARRYSYDDPQATVIVVSEDGPVSVLRNGVVQPVPLTRPSLSAGPV